MSETEPVYEYIKGQGWVVNADPDTITVTNAHGTWTLRNRKPKYGEGYAIFSKTDLSDLVDGDKVNIRGYAAHILLSDWKDWFQTWPYNNPLFSEHHVYCVVEFTPFK